MANSGISVICAGVFFIAAMIWGVVANFGSADNKSLWNTALYQGVKNGAAGLFIMIFGCSLGDSVIPMALIMGIMSVLSAVAAVKKKVD